MSKTINQQTTAWKKIDLKQDEKGNYCFDETKLPFNGETVLLKYNSGVVSGWWDKGESYTDWETGFVDCDGFQWVCLDDEIQLELESPTHWMEVPK